jgi:TolA-binding protein
MSTLLNFVGAVTVGIVICFAMSYLWLWQIQPRLNFVNQLDRDYAERLQRLEAESDAWKRAVQTLGNNLQTVALQVRQLERQMLTTQRQIGQVHRLSVLQNDVESALMPDEEIDPPPEPESTWYDRLLEEDKYDPKK